MITTAPMNYGKYMADTKKRRRLRLEDLVLSFGITLSVWTLVIVFVLVLPSIGNEIVHRSDRDVLQTVQRLAVAAAAGSAVSSGIMMLCVVRVWKRTLLRRRQREGASRSHLLGSTQ